MHQDSLALKSSLRNQSESFEQRLEHFESAWQQQEPPDIAEFCRSAGNDPPHRVFLQNLIELDLEYRWRRFRSDAPPAAQLDSHGFPQFPRLEDYAKVIPHDVQDSVLSPELAAEEYRVRTLWGDVPGRQQFLSRFTSDPDSIESALRQVESDIEIDHTESRVDDSASMFQASTVSERPGMPVGPALESTVLAPRDGDVGKYNLVRRLGRGAFGEVWQAWDPSLKRNVAIKRPRRDRVFTREELQQFHREAQKLAQLGRVSGIVSVFDFGEQNDQPYIVTDYIEGQSLKEVLKRKELSADEAVDIVLEMADALSEAHKHEIYHRDVKPGNILLDEDGKAYLADFGLAVTQHEQERERHAIVGTFAYMSTEQAKGDSSRIDGRTDIYALGAVLYRLLTGKVVFFADSETAYLEKILHESPVPPREHSEKIAPELERICLKCLRKKPSERYSTAEELANDLRRLREPSTLRKMLLPGGVLAAGLVLGAIGVFGGYNSGPPDWAQPKLLVWESNNEQEDEHGYVKETETFDFETNGHALFGFDECDSDRLHIRMKCLIKPGQSDKKRKVGVFWGYQSFPSEDDISGCCWAAWVRPDESTGNAVLEIEQIQVGMKFGRHHVKKTLKVLGGTIPLKAVDGPSFEFIMVANPNSIEEITVNGKNALVEPLQLSDGIYPKIEAREWRRLRNTKHGVYGENGSFSVVNFLST